MRLHRYLLSKTAPVKGDSKPRTFVKQLVAFGYKEALSCIFPAFIFLVLALSHVIKIPGIPRYDFLLIACIIAQLVLLISGLESRREFMVIIAFHVLGVVLEWHKVSIGSWAYPEFAYSKFLGVPLYSGFMYSSVASYICQAWRHFELKIDHWPNNGLAIGVGTLIYLNFFTNAWVYDVRWVLVGLLLIVFRKTTVSFTPNGKELKMPLLLSFFLIGFFLWLAENIATFLGAWKYAYQHASWEMVDTGKLTSWSLLVIVSLIIVVQLKRYFPNEDAMRPDHRTIV